MSYTAGILCPTLCVTFTSRETHTSITTLSLWVLCLSLDRILAGTSWNHWIWGRYSPVYLYLISSCSSASYPRPLGNWTSPKNSIFSSLALSLCLSTPLWSKPGGKIATILCRVNMKVKRVKRDYVLLSVRMMRFRTTLLKTGIPIWNNERP